MMGLLDYADAARKKLAGLLGDMPLVQIVQGRAEMPTRAGLLGALKSIPVFSPDAGQSAYEAALNIGPMGLGKIVYHGSPHKFDKFDASKIGTGEGAQAYGHGIYAADQPTTAASYKRAGTSDKWDDSRGVMEAIYEAIGPMSDGSVTFGPLQTRYAKDAFINQGVKNGWSTVYEKLTPSLQKKVNDAIEPPGNLYKADLPDEWIPKMLDWDKPLIEQDAHIQKIIREAFTDEKLDYLTNYGIPTNHPRDVGGRVTGAQIYDGIGREKNRFNADGSRVPLDERKRYATKVLQELGIPGIRYLDGGSRGKGQGSYNYVVFPGLEDQVKILERNGVPLSGLLGGK